MVADTLASVLSPTLCGPLSLLAAIGSLWLLVMTLPSLMYLGLLALFSWRMRPARLTADSQRFVVVVPAHNESAQIAQTVQSLLSVDYPKENFEVWVVADNCSDDTAAVAKAAGAHVLERQNATLRGKGYALNYAFDKVMQKGSTDAVVVIDADTIVNAILLRAFAARLVDGELAVQAEYAVRNPFSSWRTRLMAVALGMFHRTRGIARERFGLSAGLRGNGMCFSVACLQRFAHEAFGLVEDVEYGIALGLGGVRVAYADEAQVKGEMVSGGKASESQRDRWEDGRDLLRKEKLPVLVRTALSTRSFLLLDLAIDLAIPPLGRLAGRLITGSVLGALAYGLWLAVGPSTAGWAHNVSVLSLLGQEVLAWGWSLAWLGMLLYAMRGMALSHLGFGAITAMAGAPGYLVWKVMLSLRPKRQEQAWVRTARENEHKRP